VGSETVQGNFYPDPHQHKKQQASAGQTHFLLTHFIYLFGRDSWKTKPIPTPKSWRPPTVMPPAMRLPPKPPKRTGEP